MSPLHCKKQRHKLSLAEHHPLLLSQDFPQIVFFISSPPPFLKAPSGRFLIFPEGYSMA